MSKRTGKTGAPASGRSYTPDVTLLDRPAGVARLLKRRARRVPATYLLGQDPTVPALPRALARALSAYERSTLRAMVLAIFVDLPLFDGPVLWLARRVAFVAAGRPRGDDDSAYDRVVPGSGWRGSLLALTVRAGLIGATIALLRR